jgi:PAS domain S-box-containing protein
MGRENHSRGYRERARQLYRERGLSAEDDDLPPEKLIEELRIHQIELELQNQELEHSREEAERARKQAEAARDRYYTLFHHAPAGHVVVDGSGRIEQGNERAAGLLGVPHDRLVSRNLFALIGQSESSHAARVVLAAFTAGRTTPVTVSLSAASEGAQFVELSATPFDTDTSEARLLVSLLDVTDRHLQAQEHRRDADHYRRLLREMNHRVKNNLQVLSSIVELERHEARNDERLVRIAQRIRNVSRIHTALHEAATDVEEVDVVGTLQTFLEEFRAALAAGVGITFSADADELRLSAGRALALGLLVNELVTNAVRHAFPDGRPGSVGVRLSRTGERGVVVIADDGVGMGTTASAEAASSGAGDGARPRIGTELVRQLTAELGASWVTTSDRGVRHEITFPLE